MRNALMKFVDLFYLKCYMSKILSLCQICYESINEVFQVLFRLNMVYIKFYQKRDFLSQYNDSVFDYFLCFSLRHKRRFKFHSSPLLQKNRPLLIENKITYIFNLRRWCFFWMNFGFKMDNHTILEHMLDYT